MSTLSFIGVNVCMKYNKTSLIYGTVRYGTYCKKNKQNNGMLGLN